MKRISLLVCVLVLSVLLTPARAAGEADGKLKLTLETTKREYLRLEPMVSTVHLSSTGLNQVSSSSPDALTLTLYASKKSYRLGEKIDLSFSLTNRENKDLLLKDVLGTGTGFLDLECTNNGRDFFGCSDPSWGTLDFNDPSTPLAAGETIFTSTSILWDWKVQDVPTYIFLKAGVYNVNARYTAHLLDEKGKVVPYDLRSDPIQIEILEPRGEDLEVWNKIKDDGNFAYLLQRDHIRIPFYKKEERAKFKQKVEEIIKAHPNSSYTESLNQSLMKSNAAEEKLKARMEKFSQPQ